ncbi:MAG: metallophosphoesterase [Fusobacteriaceae bacterium]|jgi:predicted MPP superfamily phosphohydrolase|nr:metallophosphoesterase [Fusobacteriaceae bacterium]
MKIKRMDENVIRNIKNKSKNRSIFSIIFSYILKLIIAFILLIVFAIFAAPKIFNEQIEVSKYNIITEKHLAAPLKIAVIADLHGAYYGDGQEELLSKIKNESPDFVVLAGDIVDDKTPDEGSFILMNGLKDDNYPMYYVSGNHEYWTKRIEKVKDEIMALGIKVLEGHTVVYTREIEENVDNINISGIDDPEDPYENTVFQLKRAYSEIEEIDNYKILIAHRPELIEEYLEYPYDLIISGHAHGGQWRIPHILERGFFAPNQGFFPKYTQGETKYGNTTHIISRGLSSRQDIDIPRVFNRPELVIIEISSENN